MEDQDYVTLKWGTLKSWRLTSEEGEKLLKEYYDIGSSYSAMAQKDTPKQKELICGMIDTVAGDICLDWDDKSVSKEEAKEYVMSY